MSTTPEPAKGLLDIRKYSNRRYYDATRSRHLTLEEIRDLIKNGYDIRVTDNDSGADITSKILAQIILDLDSPKFDLFPASLLTQLIRVNDHMLKGFYEKFFAQALQAFLDYQKLVESQLKQGGMLPAMFPQFNAWSQAMMHPFGQTAPATNPATVNTAPPAADPALTTTLEALQRQVAELQKQVKPPSGRKRRPPKTRR